MQNISLNAKISFKGFLSLLLGLAHVVDVLETDDHLVTVDLQLCHLGSDPSQLPWSEVTPSQGGHRGGCQGSETTLSGVVVSGVLPGGRRFDIAPCKH